MARFTLPGRVAIKFMTSEPSVTTAPTLIELNAGVDLVGTPQAEELAELEGFVVNSATIATPGYASHSVGNVSGDETYPESRLAFYKDDTSETIYTALAAGTTGFIAFMRDGQTTGEECELFPVTVQSRVRRPARDQAHIFDVNFAISVPYQGAVGA